MANLPNAPLVYTLGVAHFPAIPNPHHFASLFHEAIRAEYPHYQHITLPQVSVTAGPEGLKLEQHLSPIWQFSAPDRSWAFILTPALLAIHTVAYSTHGDFIDRLRHGLSRLLAVDGIGISYVGAVGVRYVDRVIPREGEVLSDYLKEFVLPPEFSGLADLKLEEGVYVSRYSTPDGDLRFQVLRNPPAVLPPELETALTQQNGWKFDRPSGSFAVVDIDYGARFEPPKPMDVDFVCDRVLRLRGRAKAVFENIGTSHAMSVWNEKRS
ncbi:TIGR04255 family protein [Methylobacterium sp. J-070]|uniref:TIGR04255 family protein n=1 Tax=Methylobacterium sp. J-070 TaxID=2836650 RepID=UPI001FB8AA84|nr:TIGR04255 family protein [Methylobacterium sp. J-070]MCJ2052106.1 TIGR04255 family protein [Methylobacterium sp. J-070]